MKPRAFVVMPFGKKPPVSTTVIDGKCTSQAAELTIDFDAVYGELLEPALREAGCEPVRADSETSAGDIRTDMFFELVTADLVVADISIPNPNVFYELGVRHGVRAHGVLVVQGSFGSPRPFDVAPDRCFNYDGTPFSHARLGKTARAERLGREVKRLSQTFKHALAGEHSSIGSPVYEHLPGLVCVNWENIQTSRASFFGALRDDWLECVRTAQLQGHPGDIVTLADDAPTLLHRSKILFQAALALIDLGRYQAAERELRAVIEHNPNHSEAQIQLGRVLAQQDKADEAELHLRGILRQHENQPEAADLLGQVFRRLWHLSWRAAPGLPQRQRKAIEASDRAALAIDSFLQAQQLDSRAYFAGFNALILIAALRHLAETTHLALSETTPDALAEMARQLHPVVLFSARNARDRARKSGDYVEQFWATTTLSGIALLDNDAGKALDRVSEACAIPGATFFQIRTLQERLQLLDELAFRPDFVQSALAIVASTLQRKNPDPPAKRVFLFAAAKARLSQPDLDSLGHQIESAILEWNVTEGDLAICAGVHEGDILFAEAFLARKARVRLMLPEPFRPFTAELWDQRFHALRSALKSDVWFQAGHLGAAPDDATPAGRRNVQARHKRWMLNTARFEAEATNHLYGLFLTDHHGVGEDLARMVEEFEAYQGTVKRITLPSGNAP